MRARTITLSISLLCAAVLLSAKGMPEETNGRVPVSSIEAGKSAPSIGLIYPLLRWAPLPKTGLAVASGVYPPQAPFGASATITLAITKTERAFIEAYTRRLAAAGFRWQRASRGKKAINEEQNRLILVKFDRTSAGSYVQLTFWEAPLP